MKVLVKQVITTESSDYFGWVDLELVPETEEEKKLFRKISDNHFRICDKELDESAVDFSAVFTNPNSIEMEILFPK